MLAAEDPVVAATDAAEPIAEDAAPGRRGRAPVRIAALLWLVLLVAGAALAPWLPLAEARDPSRALDEPTAARPDLFSDHPLGTDRQGLDLLAQVVEGARVSLLIAAGAVAIGLGVGGTLGLLAGYLRGWPERVVQILTDTLLAYPPLILLLAVVTAFEPSTATIAGALGLLVLPTYARLTRAGTLQVREQEFVLAAEAAGARTGRIMLREVAPNVAASVVAYSFVVGATLIVAEASLSFLGVGIQRPAPTWGNMMAAGQVGFEDDPHLVLVPGVVLFVTVFALNQLGEAVRHRLDPREAQI